MMVNYGPTQVSGNITIPASGIMRFPFMTLKMGVTVASSTSNSAPVRVGASATPSGGGFALSNNDPTLPGTTATWSFPITQLADLFLAGTAGDSIYYQAA